MNISLIVARINGLDGVALQVAEYANVLSEMGHKVKLIAGEDEKKIYGSPSYPENIETVIADEMSLKNQNRIALYKGQFKGENQMEEKEWEALLEQSSNNVYESIMPLIQDSDAVFVYNFLALRHYHPANAVGLQEVIKDSPAINFISHAADPDSERPDVIANLTDFAKRSLSCKNDYYSGGPVNYQNLSHIVLNPSQARTFKEKHGIENVFTIPDIINANIDRKKEDLSHIIDVLNNNQISGEGNISENDTFFVSPVRPVRRKRLKEAMEFMEKYNPEGVFIVTHPDGDDPEYASEIADYAKEKNLRYVYTGKDCTHNLLHNLYNGLSSTKSIGVVASNAGGFENAILESMSYGIPVIVSNELNSYPILKEFGFKIGDGEFREFQGCSDYINDSFDESKRKYIAESNMKKLNMYFSRESAKEKIDSMLAKVGRRDN